MWIHAGHPGWERLGLGVLFGPLAAPLPLVLLEDNPAAALVAWLTTANDFTRAAAGVAYPATI